MWPLTFQGPSSRVAWSFLHGGWTLRERKRQKGGETRVRELRQTERKKDKTEVETEREMETERQGQRENLRPKPIT